MMSERYCSETRSKGNIEKELKESEEVCMEIRESLSNLTYDEEGQLTPESLENSCSVINEKITPSIREFYFHPEYNDREKEYIINKIKMINEEIASIVKNEKVRGEFGSVISRKLYYVLMNRAGINNKNDFLSTYRLLNDTYDTLGGIEDFIVSAELLKEHLFLSESVYKMIKPTKFPLYQRFRDSTL